jgi:CheY-like chemotaxis protein
MSDRILLVDDEPGVLNALRRLLMLTPCAFNGQRFRLQVDTFGDPEAALRAADHTAYALVISDYRMPGITQVRWGPDGSVILDPDLQAEYERMNPHG